MALFAAVLALAFGVSLAAAYGARAYVYWTNSGYAGTVGRANPDGTGVNQSFIGGALYPEGVAVEGTYIYWGDGTSIARANLDGTGVDRHFINLPMGVKALAVDGAHVYWADYYGGRIGRANLDGTGVNPNFITGGYQVDGVAVDGAHVYWTNLTLNLGRANLDGSGVNQSFIPVGSMGTGGVAVDGAHVYWGDFSSIGRANLDGTGVNPNFIGLSGLSNYPEGLAVDDRYVYWAAPSSGAVGRANLDGTGVNQSFITGGPFPTQVAAFPGHTPTAMRVDCLSYAVPVGTTGTDRCTVTVADQTGSPSTPTGTVTVTATSGSLDSSSCTLTPGSWVVSGAAASCNVYWKPPAGAAVGDRYTITARYTGERFHDANSVTSGELVMIPPLLAGGAPPPLPPQLSNVTQSAKRWRLGSALPHYASANPPVGTTFRFTLDKRAPVKFAFTQTVTGRRVDGKCVPSTKRNRGKLRCQRTVTLATLRHQGNIGKNSLHFEGRINRHQWLAPGTYTLRITATDRARQSQPAFLRFTILPALTPTAGNG